MSDLASPNPNLILPVGTQVVALVEARGTDGKPVHPRGAAGVVIQSPSDYWHSYRVRFPDGFECAFRRPELAILSHYKQGRMHPEHPLKEYNLFDFVIYRCVVGSQAYGLAGPDSDIDRRGVYLPPADLHWSLYGVLDQLENPHTEETYWELQKFLTMALKANPNVLECLYTPLVEHATGLAREMLDMRSSFLSKMVYQTYDGYVMSQFKKLQADLRNKGQVKWKHVMHLIRLLLSGIAVLRDGYVPVRVDQHRDQLLAIKRGDLPWNDVESWRLDLHRQFDEAFRTTKLPDRPDYERANALLLKARQIATARPGALNNTAVSPIEITQEFRPPASPPPEPPSIEMRLAAVVQSQPHPLIFATISGAHLYGFPSPDSDYDLRGVHVLPVRDVVGLNQPEDTIEISRRQDGLELDLVTHDARKFFTLMLRKNGYVLEQLYSPLVIHTTPEHAELKAIGRSCITRHHAHHYFGFAETQWKLFEKEQPRRVKPLLYVYRVLLTGIHLMQTGEIQANLLRLNEQYRLSHIDDLIRHKLAGPEKSALPDADFAFHQAEYARLRTQLQQAFEASHLPESPTAQPALNDLLIRLRTRPA